MTEDAGLAQAQALLHELYVEVENITCKYENLARSLNRVSVRVEPDIRHRLSILRRELYEVHHLIDGLHRRFPETQERRLRSTVSTP